MIKRLIFDVDNTLIKNVSFRDAIKKTLTDLDVYSEESVDNFIKGIGTYEKIYNNYNKEDYTNHMSEHINKKLGDNFLDTFIDNLKNVVPENNDEVAQTIKTLSEKYDLVLLTNYFSKSQMNRLNTMGIGQYFKECFGESLIKPNDGAYINACGMYSPEECVMIGDDLFLDVECAKKNGLKAILVNTKKIDVGTNNIVVVDKVQDINVSLIESLS